MLNLYRIMTDVRAGVHQRSVAAGDLGIVTLWVRAESESAALVRARFILRGGGYEGDRQRRCGQRLHH